MDHPKFTLEAEYALEAVAAALAEETQHVVTDSEDQEGSSRPSKRQKTGGDLDQIASVPGWPPQGGEGAAAVANGYTDGQRPTTGGPRPSHQYIVVYRVSCDRRKSGEEDHSQHLSHAYYQDEPRMFAKDTRGSALRGRSYIPDLNAYLGDQQPLAFLVCKDYSCSQYHDRMQEEFVNLAPGNIDRASFLRLKPWFQTLPHDTEPVLAATEQISIWQEGLILAFEQLISRDDENLGFWNREHSLRAPYDYFYHSHRCIRQLLSAKVDPSDTTSFSINLLLDYVESACGHEWADTDALFEQGRVTAQTFSKLFRPREIIVRDEDGVIQAFMAARVDPLINNRTSISCWSLEFDGALRRESTQITVEWRGGRKDRVAIRDLEAWPLRLDREGLQSRLARRGVEFWQCRHRRLVSYVGPQGSSFEVQTGSPKFMVDVDTHRTLHPAKYAEYQLTQYEEIDMSKEEPPSGSIRLLMPAKVPGFGFHDKKWRSLQVDHIRGVVWNENAFKRLVLKASKKELIQALVTIHLENNQATDVIEGKGAGLIMLLHGPPGTGKTLTAETVAELANKPLYRVTCGDIGTDAESVEKYLESALYLGTVWDCVVLLDEADVFLEERTQNDMMRNALVSVFLRVLEYFNGILLLTSNRVGLFDEAFESRIQLAIRYPPLDDDGRAKIWDNFFKALHKAEAQMDFDDLSDNVKSLARKELNGRQIRNVIKTARQLAAFRKQRFGMQHLECAIEVVEEFEKYLVDTRGPDDYYARQQRLRCD